MAIGWMTVLKLVPWGDVIKNAPAVAEGARKLWDSRKTPAAVKDVAPAPSVVIDADSGEPDAAALMKAQQQLQLQLSQAEASIVALNEQMQATSLLIKALAEQNSGLIQQIETLRKRWLWLGVPTAVLALIGAVAAVASGWPGA